MLGSSCVIVGLMVLSDRSDSTQMKNRVVCICSSPARSSARLCICPAAAASSFWSVWALPCQLKVGGQSCGSLPPCSSCWGRGSEGGQPCNNPSQSFHQHQQSQRLQISTTSTQPMMSNQPASSRGAQHRRDPAARRVGAGAVQAAAAALLGCPCSGVLCWSSSSSSKLPTWRMTRWRFHHLGSLWRSAWTAGNVRGSCLLLLWTHLLPM